MMGVGREPAATPRAGGLFVGGLDATYKIVLFFRRGRLGWPFGRHKS